jgi:hypothetical protein
VSSSHRQGNPAQFLGVGKLVEIPEAKMLHEILCGFVKQGSARNFRATGDLDECAIEQSLQDTIHGNAPYRLDVGPRYGLAVKRCQRFKSRALRRAERYSGKAAAAREQTPADRCQPAALRES